jgi:hypothetical protein
MAGVQKAAKEAATGGSTVGWDTDSERAVLRRAKQAMLICAGATYQRFGDQIEEQQEVVAALSDMVIGIYAAESSLLRAEKLRAEKLGSQGRGESARDMARLLVYDLLADVRRHGSAVLAVCGSGEKLAQTSRLIGRLTDCLPLDTITVRRSIADRLIAAEKFVL